MSKRCIKPIVLRAITVAAAGALTLAWNTANAQWYGGASLGQSKMKDASSQLVGTSFEDTDTAFKIYGGYQFHRNVGVEFGYINFGTFKGSGSIGGTALSDNWKANGINVSAVGTWPLANQFSLLGKLGFTRWSVDDKFSVGGLSGASLGPGRRCGGAHRARSLPGGAALRAGRPGDSDAGGHRRRFSQ